MRVKVWCAGTNVYQYIIYMCRCVYTHVPAYASYYIMIYKLYIIFYYSLLARSTTTTLPTGFGHTELI